jgi:hypothetical protein
MPIAAGRFYAASSYSVITKADRRNDYSEIRFRAARDKRFFSRLSHFLLYDIVVIKDQEIARCLSP